MIIHNIEQRSEAWFAEKAGKVTGTRFKSLMMAEATQGYKDLVDDITCELITGKMEETYSNADMEKGIETEPMARAEYESIFETEVKTVGFITPDEDTKYFGWIGISPDGIIEPGMVEIKCPKNKTQLRYIEANRLPLEYVKQVQGQLFVTGLDYCDFMSYVENMKPFIIRVFPDKELFEEFEKRLDKIIVQIENKIETYNKYNHEPTNFEG